MPLNHFQKSFIKKNRKTLTILQISQKLNIPEPEISHYIQKKLGGSGLVTLKKDQSPNYNIDFKRLFIDNLAYLLILTFLVLGVYLNSLDNAFLSDDLAEIVNNPKIGDLWYSISYRPVGFIRLIFYWIAFQIGGLNQILFRLINVFLHLGTVFLVFFIAASLYSKRIAIFTAAIFAVHPILIESVAWISGGSYPQYSLFFLLSFLFYIFSGKNKYFYPLSVLTFLFSFMSHPVMPGSLILIYPLYELIFGNFKKHWVRAIPYFLICLVFVLITLNTLPERENTLQSVHYQERGVDNIFVLVPIAISSYLNLIAWPKDLTLYHSELAYGLLGFTLISIEFLAFLGIIAASFKFNRHIFFWLSFFFISLLPTLTPFRLNWIMAERYVYLGSIGIFLSLAIILDTLIKKDKLKPLFTIILVILVTSFSIRTILRNIDWHNEDNLWIATGKTSPSSPNTHNNLGDVYGRQGDKQKALAEFQKAIALKPNYADAYHNLANTYHELKQDDKSLENYQKAVEFNPKLWQSYQNIAAIYYQQKDYQKALENIQKALNISPQNLNLVNNLGIIYLTVGDKEKAKQVFTTVVQADPKNQLANQGLIEASK